MSINRGTDEWTMVTMECQTAMNKSYCFTRQHNMFTDIMMSKSTNHEPIFTKLKNRKGLPWWRSGWESACQCSGDGPGRSHMPRSNYARAPQLLSLCSRAREPQLLKPAHLEPVLHNKRSHRNEKPAHHNKEQPLLTAITESPRAATKTQHSQK